MAAAGNKQQTNKGKGSAGRGRKAAQSEERNLRANAGRSRDEQAAPLLDEGSGRDIAGVLLGVFAVASFIAVISPSSAPVTAALAGFFHLGFGLGGYILPLFILGAAALLFLRGTARVPVRTCAGAAVIYCAVLAMLSLSVVGADVPASALFEPTNLSATGGYLGAFIASALMAAVGKTIAYVILAGLVLLGLVIIGFSVSELTATVAARAEQIARRRHVDVNESPWGEAPVPARQQARVRATPRQASLFDDEEGSAETTYLGARSITARDRIDDELDAPQGDDNPFVDVTDQVTTESAKTTLIPGRRQKKRKPARDDVAPSVAPDRAKTTLIPVKERFVEPMDEVDPMAGAAVVGAGGALGAIAASRAELDAVAAGTVRSVADIAAEPEGDAAPPWDEPAGADDAAPAVPDFLKRTAAAAPAAPAHREKPAAVAPSAADAAAARPKPRRAAAPQAAAGGTATPASATDEGDERQLPPVSMLRHNPASASSVSSEKELQQTASALQDTLQEFGLHSRVVGWISGPTVTTFKVQPGEGERVSRISNLEDDIALSLATDSVRIFAPIPGTSLVGIEIPNRTRQTVAFGDILPYVKGGPLEFALGRDAEGQPMVADLAKMPHLLIAGTTGSGKSVVISSILMSLLMRTFPEDVRLIMIDPKRVEFAPYDGLPHLYVPVVTEPKQAASALQWAVSEMERRLKIFERIGVRKISTFNEKQAAGEFEKYDNPPAKMPYLVIVIDELSDLMMVAGKDVEASIVRIAQLGRAAGIHMIVATQRPSSNVVTGLIKANITNRIGLTVATGIDSRVILDQTGAEKLIGQGDMLFSRVDWGKPKRIQGCYVSDEEIFAVVEFVKEQSPADYHEEILSAVAPAAMGGGGGGGAREASDDDPLIWEAARIVVESQLGSTSGLQRRLKVGYARAGRIMDMLEEKGVVGPPDGSKPREVLLDEEGLAALEAVEAEMAAEDGFGGF